MSTADKPSQLLKPGFSLPAVLVIVAGLLILAMGSLIVAGIERQTARLQVDQLRADLAARAGLADVESVLVRETSNDNYMVVQVSRSGGVSTGREVPAYLYLASGIPNGDATYRYRLRPLFSHTPIQSMVVDELKRADIAHVTEIHEEPTAAFSPLPYLDSVRVSWMPIHDGAGRMVGRYAYWLEDLQGRLNPATAGNASGDNGAHARFGDPSPERSRALPLEQAALYVLDPDATAADQGSLAKRLMNGRGLLVSPDSLLAAAGFEPPLVRDDTGRLVDRQARAVEENLVAGTVPYDERPQVPFTAGIESAIAGQPKLDLNRILAAGENGAARMADFIAAALPDFVARKGGFPENYLRTLAANAIDYADIDSSSTIADGSHRGLDAFPLVSEFLMRFRWDGLVRENGRVYVLISANTYVELWNMTNQTVEGEAEVSYETRYRLEVGANPDLTLHDLSEADHELIEWNGHRWFPAITVSLAPNQYRLIHCGTVRYRIDAGPASLFVPSPLTLSGEVFGKSGAGYRLKWNGQLVDGSRGGVHRNDASLHFPSVTLSQATRATVPGHSYTRQGVYRNNMGDPRMAYYLQAPQDANSYPGNYSPNRRTVRWHSIYKPDLATKPKVHGRVMPSEWPDGGHNSLYGISFQTTDVTVLPDDPRFFENVPPARREEAPMPLSNLGWFYSVTELGRVYDPLMWEAAMPAGPGLPWGDVVSDTLPSSDFGGGNTLRIGRPEHPGFAKVPGMHAARLLDLFYAASPRSEADSEGKSNLTRIWGHVNVNTATRETLRALIAGPLVMDPVISRRTSENHETNVRMAPPVQLLDDAARELPTDRIVDAILECRPFASASELAAVRDSSGEPVFGNRALFEYGVKVQWSDAAAEELFARAYDAATVRSRNFRIWTVGQSIEPISAGSTEPPRVLAEVRKVFTAFADPGERDSAGAINPSTTRLRILYENDF
jgi:hypothetical protein